MGQQEVSFFQRSGLPRDALAKVWSLGDSSRRGYLDVEAFARSMKYLSLAQAGKEMTPQVFESEEARGGIPRPAMKGLDDELAATTNPFGAPEGAGGDGGAGGAGVGASPGLTRTGFNMESLDDASRRRRKKEKALGYQECTSIIDGLKKIYFTKIKPLEEAFSFASFFSPCMTEGDFDAKPSVLLLGQYSTGKTTFVKHLLGRDYPGTNIGPEPTTDRFVVVFHGPDERRIPGNTLTCQTDRPYQGLTMFGGGFLGRFEGAQCNECKLLEEVSFVDTPGVLSGEKQRLERSYNFIGVCEWFAYRCDLILLLFDPYKLDISDEFKNVINTLKGHDDKVRVVLNKSDQVESQQLMRVYGALMWSLGKVFRSPEVVRVYIGSFNDKPIDTSKNNLWDLFEKEQEDLLNDLYLLPERSCDRKVNEFVKRVRAAKIHCLIVSHLRQSFGMMTMNKKDVQKKLLRNLEGEFAKIQRKEQLPPGDFPDPGRYRQILQSFDLWKFPKYEPKQLKVLDTVLSTDIPNLLREFDNPFGNV